MPNQSSFKKKLISIVTPCFNEEENIEPLIDRINATIRPLDDYDFEHIFIDNASTDSTVEKIHAAMGGNPHIKLIVNTRNFGHLRSPTHALFQASGDAIILMASDLQTPPELIPQFIEKWEAGFPMVAGVKTGAEETLSMKILRGLYYQTIGKISEIDLIPHFTGFGLYDRKIIETIRSFNDPYPYFRGLISEIGMPYTTVSYVQPKRNKGITKNNLYILFDTAMLGMTTHSKLPIRLATITGLFLSIISLTLAIFYTGYKIYAWESFALGTAPIIIGLFFFASVQLFFIGIIGEYIGALHTQVLKRPLVIEKERFNFVAQDHEGK